MENDKGEAAPAMEENENSKSHSHDHLHQDQDLCSPLSSITIGRKLLRRKKPLEESSLPADVSDAAHPAKKKKLTRKKSATAVSLQTTTDGDGDGDGSEGVGQIVLALRSSEPTTKPTSHKNNPTTTPLPDHPAALHNLETQSLPHPSPSKSRAIGAELPATDAGSQTNNLSLSLSELLALFDSASSVHKAAAVYLPTSTFVNVYGYMLKPELEATARTILDKHGDIIASTGFEGSLRSQLLEKVCSLYTTLENSTFNNLKLEDLRSMQTDVKDYQKMNVDVGWLINRLHDIVDARKVCEESLSLIKPNMKQMADLENELRIKEAAMQEIQDTIQDIKAKLATEKNELEANPLVLEVKTKVKQFWDKSLVDGI